MLSRYYLDIIQFFRNDAIKFIDGKHPQEICALCAYILSAMELARPGIMAEVFAQAFNRFIMGNRLMNQQFIEENGPQPADAVLITFPDFDDFSGNRPNITLYLSEPESDKVN